MILHNALPLIDFLSSTHCHKVNFAHSLMSRFTLCSSDLGNPLTQDEPFEFSFSHSRIDLLIHLILISSLHRHSRTMAAFVNYRFKLVSSPSCEAMRSNKTPSTLYMTVLTTVTSDVSSKLSLTPLHFHNSFQSFLEWWPSACGKNSNPSNIISDTLSLI